MEDKLFHICNHYVNESAFPFIVQDALLSPNKCSHFSRPSLQASTGVINHLSSYEGTAHMCAFSKCTIRTIVIQETQQTGLGCRTELTRVSHVPTLWGLPT